MHVWHGVEGGPACTVLNECLHAQSGSLTRAAFTDLSSVDHKYHWATLVLIHRSKGPAHAPHGASLLQTFLAQAAKAGVCQAKGAG